MLIRAIAHAVGLPEPVSLSNSMFPFQSIPWTPVWADLLISDQTSLNCFSLTLARNLSVNSL